MKIKKVYSYLHHLITSPAIRFGYLSKMGFYNWMSDEKYLKKKYKLIMGKELNLDNPKTFNEKIQWLKLYNRDKNYTMLADKFCVREYIEKEFGKEYLIPLLGVWDNLDDINFEQLPNQFVLKCNHNSGTGMCICRDKTKLDIKKVKRNLRKGLKENYYLLNREWPYKDIPRKIIAEQYMCEEDIFGNLNKKEKGLTDYKFYCFHGEPIYLYVSQGLEHHATAKISFLNIDWTFADFGRLDYQPFEQLPSKPKHFDEMFKMAKTISKGHLFLRVDLYEIGEKIYFGEITFFPCAGMMPFSPLESDLKLGKYLKIK